MSFDPWRRLWESADGSSLVCERCPTSRCSGRARRSPRSLVRPPLNGSIVSQTMGRQSTCLMHFACFGCRRSFKRRVEHGGKDYVKPCPHCGGRAIDLGRHFKAPKVTDIDQWKKVRYLVAAGFFFQHVHDEESRQVGYPKTLKEAHAFVSRYRSRA